ncbi:EAL domain-containing protein [Microvirga sp. 2MCAF38]|uniref:EAL domain-containing protein n=1 Tax=Microvirga sp. 2MCAF38 TaxID=3232989 RepID=UPI003F981BCF
MAKRSRAGFFGGVLWDTLNFARSVDTPAPTSGSATYTWDLSTDALAWGPYAPDALGLAPEDLPLTGAALIDLTERHGGQDRLSAILATDPAPDDDGTPFVARYTLRLSPDRIVMVDDTGRFLTDAKDHPAFVRGVVRAQEVRENRVPPPVCVEMRTNFLDEIRDNVSDAGRARHTLTLIVGTVEDSADDETTIAEIRRSARSLLRREDRFTQYAPNRFALALNSCAVTDGPNAMSRLLQVIAANPSLSEISVRLGMAGAPDHATNAADLLRRAEKALDHAVAKGERTVSYRKRLTIPASASCGTDVPDIIASLNSRDLAFARKPLVDSRTGQAVLSQAIPLVTINETFGPAQDLAPRMEAAGLSLLLDGRMLELVADHLVATRDEGMLLPISHATLEDGEWLTMLAAHLGMRPGIASRLIVSVPESALGFVAARGRLDAMKALGIGLAIHGLGTGHLSSTRLHEFPVDLATIDGRFIQTLHRSPDDRLFVRKLIEQAHSCGIAIIAEWVADQATADLLAEWGVDYLQGSLFGVAQKAASRTGERQARIA